MTEYNKDWCDERHDNIDREFEIMRTRMNGQDKKLWTIIILLIANLAGLVAFLARSIAQ